MDEVRILHQGDPNDTRFQFEVIKQLAESVREATGGLRALQETQTRMLERLARIEEQRTHEAVAGLATRVDLLERDYEHREGAANYRNSFLKYWGPITTFGGVVLTVLYLLLHAVGIIHIPSDKPEQVYVTTPREVMQPARDGREPTQ